MDTRSRSVFQYSLGIPMTTRSIADVHGHITTSEGKYPKPTNERGWWIAERVELKEGSLLLWWYPETGDQQVKLVRPDGRLFERFLHLDGSCDEDILNFIRRYGHIDAFSEPGAHLFGLRDCGNRPTIAFCSVHRYFASIMQSVVTLSARLDEERRGNNAEWLSFGDYPDIMLKVLDRKALDPENSGLLNSNSAGLFKENSWLYFADAYRDKRLALPTSVPDAKARLGVVIDSLLALADVRLHFEWRADKKSSADPRWFYSSDTLFRFLVLALCRAVMSKPNLVECYHCHGEYSPTRAPRTSTEEKTWRNFCKECKDANIPQQYANITRSNKRRNSNVKES